MSSADDILLAQPMAKAMLEAGVPRAEVIAGLQTAQPTAQEPDVMLMARSQSFGFPLPPGWEERFDPTSGRKFYVDYVNKATSWTRPTSTPSGASAVPTQHATPWSAIPSTGVAYPSEAGPSRSGTGASGSPAGEREGKKKKGLFSGWGGDPDKKRAEKEARAREEVERWAEKERAKEEAKAQERAMAEAHARELAEKAERERQEREAREREAEAARRLEREAAERERVAAERERRRNLPQTSASLLATLCEREAAAAAAGGVPFDLAETTGAAAMMSAAYTRPASGSSSLSLRCSSTNTRIASSASATAALCLLRCSVPSFAFQIDSRFAMFPPYPA